MNPKPTCAVRCNMNLMKSKNHWDADSYGLKLNQMSLASQLTFKGWLQVWGRASCPSNKNGHAHYFCKIYPSIRIGNGHHALASKLTLYFRFQKIKQRSFHSYPQTPWVQPVSVSASHWRLLSRLCVGHCRCWALLGIGHRRGLVADLCLEGHHLALQVVDLVLEQVELLGLVFYLFGLLVDLLGIAFQQWHTRTDGFGLSPSPPTPALQPRHSVFHGNFAAAAVRGL